MTESNEQFSSERAATASVSLYTELRLMLLAGLIIFSTGIAGLLYESRGNISHIVAIIAVSFISIGCFYYGYRTKSPFSKGLVQEKNSFFDFIILLGALTMLTAIAYVQFKFVLFGSKYGLATFIPMCILFFAAYYYDHTGVLGMAVTNFAAWAGIVATPRAFGIIQWEMSTQLVSTGIALGVLFELLAGMSEKRDFKPHFSAVYHWSSLNLCFISLLTGLFNLNVFLFTALIILFAVYFYQHALKEKSFPQLLFILVYLYIGGAYLFVQVLDQSDLSGFAPAYAAIFYFLITALVFARVLIHHNRQFRK